MEQPPFTRTSKNLARTLQDRGLPPEPPAENPHELASAQWQKLHDYATKLAAITAEVDDENKALRAQNESLTREVDRLTTLNADIAREHRTTTAFAQALRTRFTAIRESFEAAEREALNYASQDVREKMPPTPDEQRELEQIVSGINRAAREALDASRPLEPLPRASLAPVSWAAGDTSPLAHSHTIHGSFR